MKMYDVSFIRQGSNVALENILGMNIRVKALIKLEGKDKIDEERIERYKQIVLNELGSESGRYVLSTERINGKWGLIIERQT